MWTAVSKGMTLLVQRDPSRGRWFIWWSAVAYLALLTSSEAIAQGRRSLKAAYDDDEVIRQMSVNETEADDIIEDRMAPIEMESEMESIRSALAPFQKKMAEAISMKPVNLGHKVDDNDIITMLMSNSDEIEVREILRDVKDVMKNGQDLAVAQLEYWGKNGATAKDILSKMLKTDGKGRNILTDSSLLYTWDKYVRKNFEGYHSTRLLYSLLIQQDDLKPLAEFVLTEVKDETLGSVQTLFKLEWNAYLRESKMDPVDFYARLQLNKEPGPLLDPVLSIWADYATGKGWKDLDEWLFKKVIDLYNGKGKALLLHAMTIAETPLSGLVVGKVVYKWLEEGVTTDEIKKLLVEDKKLTATSRESLKELWEWYERHPLKQFFFDW